jgi:hypothetical protein
MADEERQLITELGDQSMGPGSSGPVLAVACQPRRHSAAGDPARRSAFAKFEHAIDPDGVLPEAERITRAEHLRKARKDGDADIAEAAAAAMAAARQERTRVVEDALAAVITEIIATVALTDERRTRLTELLGGGDANEG